MIDLNYYKVSSFNYSKKVPNIVLPGIKKYTTCLQL